MAETYRQRTLSVQKALRQAKKSLRTWDSTIERLERELARLIQRKTLVGPDSLKTTINLWTAISRDIKTVEKAIVDAVGLASY